MILTKEFKGKVVTKTKMRKQQGCSVCRDNYSSNSEERNYNNYSKYGFKDKKAFEKHSSRNKHCPHKYNNSNLNLIEAPLFQKSFPLPKWPPYFPYKNEINECDYVFEQDDLVRQIIKHKRKGGRVLWYRPSEEASIDLIMGITNPDIQFISLVAEPGSGKTMVTHCLINDISKLSWEDSIRMTNITITTGMSDKDWESQYKANLTLADGNFLLNEMNRLHDNYCLVHRSNFHKRITYILENPVLIHNHVFIIDESHVADSEGLVIDDEFERFGLTEERMKEYKIKIILISATPDVQLSILTHPECQCHGIVQLKTGENYKGFDYFHKKNMIKNFDKNVKLETIIRSTYTEPKFHYIRARTNIEKGEFQQSIKSFIIKEDWILFEDDSNNNYYISFESDKTEKREADNGKNIIRTYEKPLKHTIILIKDKYTASKRLKLTQFTGLVAEKPSTKQNTTITCNGLIPRFWGHYEEPEYENSETPLFICDLKAVEEYLKFSKNNFIYNGIDYNSKRLISNKDKTTELKNTCYSKIAGQENQSSRRDIDFKSFTNVEEIAPFLRETDPEIFENIHDITLEKFRKNSDKYYTCNRFHEGHKLYNIKLTEQIYYEEIKKNGGGSFISVGGKSGQKQVIYPVYKNDDSKPNDLIFWVHYYKRNVI